MMRRLERIDAPNFLPYISMDELYQTSFPPKQTVIDGLLYAGTYLLAGAPKIGKSYLVL